MLGTAKSLTIIPKEKAFVINSITVSLYIQKE